MSRTRFSPDGPRRGGTYRPQLEVLEGRLAPGALAGALQPPPIDPAGIAAQRDREAAQLAFLAGLQAGPLLGLNPVRAPDLPGPSQGAGGGAGGSSRDGSPAPTVTTSPVLLFDDLSPRPGFSILARTDQSVAMIFFTSGLKPGVYTFWWAVINPGTTFEDRVGGRATFAIVDESGVAAVVAVLNEGETVGDPPIAGREGTLQDARRAEIWMVVRNHGPVDPERLHEQTHTFEPDRAYNFLVTMHPAP